MKKKEKVKSKLQIAFLSLYFLEPIYLYSIKSPQKNENTQILRLKVKSLKNLLNEFFLGFVHSEKKLKPEKPFLVKNFLFCLKNFCSSVKKTKFHSIQHQHKKEKKTFFNQSLKREKEGPLQNLTCLDDLLNL